MEIQVMDKVLAANDAWAEENRKFLRAKNCVMLNLIASPGAGKTTLLERTIDTLGRDVRMGVIEGDIATSRDAERIQKKDVPVYQINTGTACHLDAHLIHTALQALDAQQEMDLVMVENIGNLVCPAEFDIGEHGKIAVLSIAEGDDKVEKYPLLFSAAAALVISKTDLLRYTNFSMEHALEAFRRLNPRAVSFALDSLSGTGFAPWIDFIRRYLPAPGDTAKTRV